MFINRYDLHDGKKTIANSFDIRLYQTTFSDSKYPGLNRASESADGKELGKNLLYNYLESFQILLQVFLRYKAMSSSDGSLFLQR